MENIATMDITADNRQAAPIRQSNTNIKMTIPANNTIVPMISAKLCAKSVSVSLAALSSLPLISPEALLSK